MTEEHHRQKDKERRFRRRFKKYPDPDDHDEVDVSFLMRSPEGKRIVLSYIPKPLAQLLDLQQKNTPPEPPQRRHYPIPDHVRRQTRRDAAETTPTARRSRRHREGQRPTWSEGTYTETCGCECRMNRHGQFAGVVHACRKGDACVHGTR